MIFLNLEKVEFRTVQNGDWNLSGWYHPDAKRYLITGVFCQKLGEEITGVFCQRLGEEIVRSLAVCSFDDEVEQDIMSLSINMVPKSGTRCSAWVIKAIGTKKGDLKIVNLKKASPNILGIWIEKLNDLELAFKKFLEG
jgi:hypothetical protein